jgi:pilus assembly protein CpaB
MNTKKIWVMSLLFGVVMAFVTYFALFSSESVSTVEKEKQEVVEKKQVVKAAENKPVKRTINNPMVKISEGKRAISLKTILEGGVSGYIEPNSMVDVIAYETTIDDNTKKKYKSSVIVLQNIKVLASGKASDSPEEALQYETVTLEVTPDQGLSLSLAAKDKDGFYFMLRNSKDKSVIEEMKRSTREVIEEGKEDK